MRDGVHLELMSGLKLDTAHNSFLSLPSHEYIGPQQEVMRRILDETEVSKKPRVEKQKKGYIQFGFSDMELLTKPQLRPSFDLDIFKIAPSTNEIIGAVRGVEGHFLYELYMHLLRLYRGKTRIRLVELQTELLTDNWTMKPHERLVLRNILEKKFRTEHCILRADLPEIVRGIRKEWRNKHVFLEKKEVITKSIKPKVTYKEGLVHSAKYIKSIWNSKEQLAFGENVIKALFSETMALQFPLETVPENQTFIECPKSILVYLPNGYKIQTRFTPDIICTPSYLNYEEDEASGIVVFDAKFGRWEERSKSPAQIFLTNSGVWHSALNQTDHPQAIRLEKMNPGKVNFNYVVVNAGPLSTKIEFQNGNLSKEEVEETKEKIMQDVEYFAIYGPYYHEIKRLRKGTAIMPYIPEEPIGDGVQKGYNV